MSLIVGIDYGVAREDIAVYTVAKKINDKLHIIDTGKIEDFNYKKYVASIYQMKFIGEKSDLDRFKAGFLNEK